MENFKVDQKIRAIDACGGALIVGKEYSIKEVLKDRIRIESEISLTHAFTFEYFKQYFELVEETPETPEIPELVGVEMEISDDGVSWDIRKVYCNTPDGYIYMNIFNKLGFVEYARPIQPKTVELTLEEIAEKLGVDKVIIKNQ